MKYIFREFKNLLHRFQQFQKWYEEYPELQKENDKLEAELISEAEQMGLNVDDDFKNGIRNMIMQKNIIAFEQSMERR